MVTTTSSTHPRHAQLSRGSPALEPPPKSERVGGRMHLHEGHITMGLVFSALGCMEVDWLTTLNASSSATAREARIKLRYVRKLIRRGAGLSRAISGYLGSWKAGTWQAKVTLACRITVLVDGNSAARQNLPRVLPGGSLERPQARAGRRMLSLGLSSIDWEQSRTLSSLAPKPRRKRRHQEINILLHTLIAGRQSTAEAISPSSASGRASSSGLAIVQKPSESYPAKRSVRVPIALNRVISSRGMYSRGRPLQGSR